MSEFDWSKHEIDLSPKAQPTKQNSFNWNQYSDKSQNPSDAGFSGVGQDLTKSFFSAPEALGTMVSSIPEGASNVASLVSSPGSGLQGLYHALDTAGVGAVEGTVGGLSFPQIFARYLSNKFPAVSKRLKESSQAFGGDYDPKDKTLYEHLMDFEKSHGLQAKNEKEQTARNLGSALSVGVPLSKIRGLLGEAGTLGAYAAGSGGDPIHGALLGSLGKVVGATARKVIPKNPVESIINAPKKIAKAVKDTPVTAKEVVGKAVGESLEAIGDLGDKVGMPMAKRTLSAAGSYTKNKSIDPEAQATRVLFGDIKEKDLPKMKERADAMKRLGLSYGTIAEYLNSPYEGAKQGNIGNTSGGSKLLMEKGSQRIESEENSINNLLNEIHDPKKLNPEKTRRYTEAMNQNVPDEFIQKHQNRPVIAAAIKELHSKPAFRQELGNIPDNTFGYWNMVKRVMGAQEGRLEGSVKPGTKDTEAAVIGKTRREMVSDMDKIHPGYKIARSISEREHTRNDIEKFFNKRQKTGNEFHNYLKDKNKYNKLVNKLSAFPKAQAILKDMKMVFGDLIPETMSIRTAKKLAKTSMDKARNPLDAKKLDFENRFGQDHDIATVNLMTNPNLMNILIKHIKEKS